MGIQEITTYAIVGIAMAFTARIFIRQFISTEGSCPKCPQCGSRRNTSDEKPNRLIQIEDRAGPFSER